MTHSKGTLYAALGLSEGATRADIRRAYHALALEWHPDKVADARRAEATERFKYISEAYITLSDDDARDAYDRELAKRLEREYVAARESLLHEKALQRTQEREMHARYMYAQAQAQAHAQAQAQAAAQAQAQQAARTAKTPPPFPFPPASPTFYVPLSPQASAHGHGHGNGVSQGAAQLGRSNSHLSRHSHLSRSNSHLSRSNSNSRHAPHAHVHAQPRAERTERSRHSYAGPRAYEGVYDRARSPVDKPRTPAPLEPRSAGHDRSPPEPRSSYDHPRPPIYEQYRSASRSPYDLPPAHPFAPPKPSGAHLPQHLRAPHARGKSTSALDELLRSIERNERDGRGEGLSRAASFARAAAKARDMGTARESPCPTVNRTRLHTFHEMSRDRHSLDSARVLSPNPTGPLPTPPATALPAHQFPAFDRGPPSSQVTEAQPAKKQPPADFEHSRPFSFPGIPARERKSFIKTKFAAASRLNPFSRTSQVARSPAVLVETNCAAPRSSPLDPLSTPLDPLWAARVPAAASAHPRDVRVLLSQGT